MKVTDQPKRATPHTQATPPQIGIVICPERPYMASVFAEHLLLQSSATPTLWMDGIDFRDREGQGMPVALRHDLEQVRVQQKGWTKACTRFGQLHWYASARRLQQLDASFLRQSVSRLHPSIAPLRRILLSAHARRPIQIELPAQLLWIGTSSLHLNATLVQDWVRGFRQGHHMHPVACPSLTEESIDLQTTAQQLSQHPLVRAWMLALEARL